MNIVALDAVCKNYALGSTIVPAVKNVSFEIAQGDFVSIIGPSGSGKSTILNMIGCIDTPSSGRLTLNGKNIQNLSESELTDIRKTFLGFIFQSFNLLPVLNIAENIMFPLTLNNHITKEQKKRNKAYVEYLIDAVGLTEWKDHKPNQLSGGQRQRVAIARALASKPIVVLADEPTANLDSKTGEDIINLMRKINKEFNTTFIFSTHDQSIFSTADHIIRLKDGCLAENYKQK